MTKSVAISQHESDVYVSFVIPIPVMPKALKNPTLSFGVLVLVVVVLGGGLGASGS